MLPPFGKYVSAEKLVQLPLSKLQEMQRQIKEGKNLGVSLSELNTAIDLRKRIDLSQDAKEAEAELREGPDVSHLIKGISAIPIPDQTLRMAGGGIVAFAKGEEVKAESPQAQFIRQMYPYALEISKQTGIAPEVLISQAALESGWGRRAPGNNLFGIKKGDWTGPTVDVPTQEFVGGRMQPVTDKFRAYDSPAASMQDWARLLDRPAYKQAREAAVSNPDAYPGMIKAAGYATDPAYAPKLSSVLRQVRASIGGQDKDDPVSPPSQLGDRIVSPAGTGKGVAQQLYEDALKSGREAAEGVQRRVSDIRKFYERARGEIKDPTAPDEESIRQNTLKRLSERDTPFLESMRRAAQGMQPDREQSRREAIQDFLIKGGAAVSEAGNRGRGLAGLFPALNVGLAVGNTAYGTAMDKFSKAKQKADEAAANVEEKIFEAQGKRDTAAEAAVTNAMREYRTAQKDADSKRDSLDARLRAEVQAEVNAGRLDQREANNLLMQLRYQAGVEAKQKELDFKEEEAKRKRAQEVYSNAQKALANPKLNQQFGAEYDKAARQAKTTGVSLGDKRTYIRDKILESIGIDNTRYQEVRQIVEKNAGIPAPSGIATVAPPKPANTVKLFDID